MRPQTRYAKSGDVRIAYQITGSGPVDLVWAPGVMSHLDLDWDLPAKTRFIEQLGSFCRLIRFDKRGTGLSDRPTVAATLEERTDDIRAVMDAANSERAVILGTSGGAPMACLFAATHPQRTRALIIWGGQARWVRTDDYPWGVSRSEQDRLVARLADHGASVEYVVAIAGLGPSVDPILLDWFVRYTHAAVSPSAAVALERINADTDIRSILPSIGVPTLVINRTDDSAAHVDAARDLAARIPGARFVELPGATHQIFLEDSAEVLSAIEEFLTGPRGKATTTTRQLVTLIMIDVVESTAWAAAVGDAAWGVLLKDYRALGKEQLATFDGRVVDTAGDGLLAQFDGPTRAIRCALAIVESVHRLGLRLRAGVHTGEVELIDGGRIAGIAVHTVARVASEAGPDEVLVTGTVKDLAAGSGVEFVDRGTHTLKGVPGAWHLFQVSGP